MKNSHPFMPSIRSFSSGFIAGISLIVSVVFGSTLAHAGFDSYYDGQSDLAISRIEQDSAQTLFVELCNEGSVSTGYGRLTLSVTSRSTRYQERNYSDVVFAAGECRAFKLQKLTGFSSYKNRSYSVNVTVDFVGDRSEGRTSNNSLTLPAKKLSVTGNAGGSGNQRTSQITEDIWGKSSNSGYFSNTYNSSNTSYYSPSNTSYYPYNYYSNSSNPNGDFYPANPTWEMQKGNTIYIYTGPGNGYWYTYTPGNNNTYYYNPVTNPSSYYNPDYPAMTTMDGEYYTVTPHAGFRVRYPGEYPGNSTGYSSTTRPTTTPYGCSNWQFNSSTGRYEWYCTGNVWGGYGKPDLYLQNLKRKGTSRELTATVCNQGDAMASNAQIAIQLSNGVNGSATTIYGYAHLVNGGCTDIPVSLSGLTMYGFAANYVFYANIDANNVVNETREDNNTSYWRILVD